MERRNFLRNMLIGGTATIVAPSVLMCSPPEYVSIVTLEKTSDWVIDYETKNIIYQGGWESTVNSKGVTMTQLYNFIQDEWKERDDEIPFKFPVIRTFGEKYCYQKVW